MSGVLTLPTPGSTQAVFDHTPTEPSLLETDREIVSLIHHGRLRKAVALTARRYGPRLHRFFARWQPRDAEDHVQEVLVRVYEALCRGRFHRHDRFGPWLFTVAANLRRDIYRTARRRGALLEQHRASIGSELHGSQREERGWSRLTRHEQRLWLAAALRDLPDVDQELLALRYDAGLPWAEVSRVLGMRPSTAKMRFTQLRRLLSERWHR